MEDARLDVSIFADANIEHSLDIDILAQTKDQVTVASSHDKL